MKRILLYFCLLSFPLFSYSFQRLGPKSAISNSSNLSRFSTDTPYQSTEFDSTLNQIEIYDPAAKNYYYGLGFPGAASRSILFSVPKTISIKPIFNSFEPFLLSTNFEVNYNLKKPLTQVEYVIFPSLKTEQYLNLFHSRNVSEHINLGLQVRKIKSNGYFLNQGSNITNILTYIDANSKNERYHVNATFSYNGLVTIENGGVINDSIDYSSRSIALQSLPVWLEDAKNRVSYWGAKVDQSFSFGIVDTTMIDSASFKKNYIPTSEFILSIGFNRHSATYLDGAPLSGYYPVVYTDSIDTFDKSIYESFHSVLSYRTLESNRKKKQRMLLSNVGVHHEQGYFERRDAIKQFSNLSCFAIFETNPVYQNKARISAVYFPQGYNAKNYDVGFSVGRNFLDSTKNHFLLDFIWRLQNVRPDYTFEERTSNHFVWKNSFESMSINQVELRLKSEKWFGLKIGFTRMNNFVFLDSLARPNQLSDGIELITGRFEKLFKFSKFFLAARLNYQSIISGRDVLGLPKFFTRSSIYWADKVFKGAMDLQIGFDFTYASSYYGLAYQPALNSFYYQKEKKIGNYPAADFFINFKIRQARLFFKVDHLNYGLSGGSYSFVPGYLLPGRTFRFGLNWLFVN